MRLTSIIAISMLLLACKKDKPNEPAENFEVSDGMVVLCEGLFQQNNSTLSFISNTNGVVDNDLFVSRTNRQLGDTGNDIAKYGGKVYIVVNVSSTIEVVDAKSFDPIKQILMLDGAISKQPRSISFANGKAYVTCYDGYVDVIDTVSLTVTSRIAVGENPEGLAIANNKLYVANSGGLNFPNMDSTLSVIDLSTNTELQKITVGLNPGEVVTDVNGNVFVITRGDYGVVPSRLVKVNPTTDIKEATYSFDVSDIEPMNNNFLISDGSSVSVFDPSTEVVTQSNFVDLSPIVTFYHLEYDEIHDQIYVLDAMNYTNSGFVRKYSSAGSYLEGYNVGLNPSKILFYE